MLYCFKVVTNMASQGEAYGGLKPSSCALGETKGDIGITRPHKGHAVNGKALHSIDHQSSASA